MFTKLRIPTIVAIGFIKAAWEKYCSPFRGPVIALRGSSCDKISLLLSSWRHISYHLAIFAKGRLSGRPSEAPSLPKTGRQFYAEIAKDSWFAPLKNFTDQPTKKRALGEFR